MTGTYPAILTHPNIPKPLHGIAPRTIVNSRTWWDVERKKCYAAASQRCEACGAARADAWPNRWLEAHECYDYQPNGHIVFNRLVCLCPACHKFIHSGLRQILVDRGDISIALNMRIQKHGMDVLYEAGLLKQWSERHEWCNFNVGWSEYRMIFEGKEYGPSTQSFEGWKAGKWRNWRPE